MVGATRIELVTPSMSRGGLPLNVAEVLGFRLSSVSQNHGVFTRFCDILRHADAPTTIWAWRIVSIGLESAKRYSIHFQDKFAPSVRHLPGEPISAMVPMFTAERVRFIWVRLFPPGYGNSLSAWTGFRGEGQPEQRRRF